VTDHEHQSPSASGQPEPRDPYAAPMASPAAPAPAWSGPTAYGPPPLGGPQPWSNYGAPYAADPNRPPEPRTTNAWSIVALVSGILAVVPVAIGSGIVALVQINRRRQAGKGMAISGLVMASVWAVVAVLVGVGAAAGMFSGTTPGADSPVSLTGRVADAGSTTTVGSCLAAPSAIDSIAAGVDCSTPHFAEVYLAQAVPGTDWPGYDKVNQSADDMCHGAFKGYVGSTYEASSYEYDYYSPDQAEWLAGEHRVVCVVVAADQSTLHTSVRNSRH
jgi:hypothetical protein